MAVKEGSQVQDVSIEFKDTLGTDIIITQDICFKGRGILGAVDMHAPPPENM